MCFLLNGLGFFNIFYYICVDPWKKFKNEFSFVSFEQDMKKRIYVNVWSVKKVCVIIINPEIL